MIVLMIVTFAGLSLIDLPALIHLKKKREIIVYLTLLLSGLVLSILSSMNISPPSTLDALTRLFELIFGRIYPQP